jgi:DNA-binding response OmpR family regulator
MTKTAIVVEDCKTTMEITKFFLTKLGVDRIFTASSHKEFQELMQIDLVPDLVVTDWNIEENFKGKDVIFEMSRYQVPIVVISAEDKIEAEDINYQYSWFKKPLNFNELKGWVKSKIKY